MSPPAGTVTHAWVHQRLGPWAAGVLNAQDQSAVDAHLHACAECRTLASHLGSEGPDELHIPTSMLARWDRAAPLLTGELRTLVQRHLERCDDCRRELITLGFSPELIAQPQGPVTLPVSPRRPWWRTWTRWHVLGAGALAAASVALVTRIDLLRVGSVSDQVALHQARPSGADRTPTPHATPPSEPTPEGSGQNAALMALGPWQPSAVHLRETLREGTGQTAITSLAFDATSHAIVIEPPPSLAALDEDRFELEVVDAGGATLRRLTTTMRAMFPRRVIVIRQGDPPLVPGRYTLVIRARGAHDERTEVSRLAFEIHP